MSSLEMSKPTSKTAGMRIYPRGAEWRKWDLHVHAPGTKQSDAYGTPAPWDEYCRIIEESDVAVIAIADYFSFDSYFQFLAEHHKRYPDSEKVFFANLELRLNETVNTAQDEVHMHLLFRPGLSPETAKRLLDRLEVQHREDSGRSRTCSELDSEQDYASATVSRVAVKDTLAGVFGDSSHVEEQVLILVPANNDGLRARESQRKKQLADEIERDCGALFGGAKNRDFFLGTDRYETDTSAPAKPVFTGSDAHSIKDLEEWLGKTVDEPSQHKETTWIKADPTFEGLTQTLVEPAERVRIQASRPDHKEPYKIIERIRFEGTDEFPVQIVLNQNLASIIGSRSSGKSALLAYIAHAINPQATLAEQEEVQPNVKADKLGPAAGKAWSEVEHIKCIVEWAAPGEHTGQVIYIPQNSLHSISQRPHAITAKIAPAVFRLDPDFQVAHEKAGGESSDANERIRDATRLWFELSEKLSSAEVQLREIGDKQAIEETRAGLQAKIEQLQKASSLSEQETADYQKLTTRLQEIQARLNALREDARSLDKFLSEDETGEGASYSLASNVRVSVALTPDSSELPEPTQAQARDLLEEAKGALSVRLQTLLGEQRAEFERERGELVAEDKKLREENKVLIEKSTASSEIETLIKERQTQDESLQQITRKTSEIGQLTDSRAAQVALIEQETSRRAGAMQSLQEDFALREHALDEMRFGLEQSHDGNALAVLAARFQPAAPRALHRSRRGQTTADRPGSAEARRAARRAEGRQPAGDERREHEGARGRRAHRHARTALLRRDGGGPHWRLSRLLDDAGQAGAVRAHVDPARVRPCVAAADRPARGRPRQPLGLPAARRLPHRPQGRTADHHGQPQRQPGDRRRQRADHRRQPPRRGPQECRRTAVRLPLGLAGAQPAQGRERRVRAGQLRDPRARLRAARRRGRGVSQAQGKVQALVTPMF